MRQKFMLHLLRRTSFLILFCVVLRLPAGLEPVGAQETSGPSVEAPAPGSGNFTTLRNRVEASELADEEKQAVLEVIAQGEKELKDAAEASSKADELQTAVKTLNERLENFKTELQQLDRVRPQLPDDPSLESLEAIVPALSADVAAAKTALNEAESAAARASKKRQEIESTLTQLENDLTERRAQIEASADAANDTLLAQARREELIASERLLSARLEALRSESALLEAETSADYYQLDRDLKASKLKTLESQLRAVQNAIEKERAAEAAEKVETAEAQLEELHAALRPIGLQNRQFAEQNQELTAKIEQTEATLRLRNDQLELLQASFQAARTRVDTVGLTEAVGTMLRNLKANLPSINEIRLRHRERQPLINDAQYELMDLTDRRNAPLEVAVQTLLSEYEEPIPIFERDVLAVEARDLLEEQRTEFLSSVIRNQTAYFNTLVSLSTTEQEIINLVAEATEYVNERVLWVRSTRSLSRQWVPSAEEWWFTQAEAWSKVGPKLLGDLFRRPIRWIVALFALLALFRYRFRVRREIETIGKQVSSSTFTRFLPTFQALLLTIVASAPVTLVFGFVGIRLADIAGDDRATEALARAALAVAMVYFPLELIRQICRRNGLGVCHFGWSESRVQMVRRWLHSVVFFFVPLVAATMFLGAGGSSTGNNVLERYAFIASCVLLAYMIGRLLRPDHGLPANYLKVYRDGWAARLSFLWYPASITIPLFLAVLTAVGYQFTAQQLTWRLYLTVCIVEIAVLSAALVLRWVLLRRRDLRIKVARASRAAREEAEALATEGGTPLPTPPAEDSAEELHNQMVQTRRLMQAVMISAIAVALWLVWNDVMVAKELLEQHPIWTSTTTATETIENAAGDAQTITRMVVDNVTIADVGFALLVVVITILATRNIPGLLEFAVLRNLPIDSSIRYAVSALSSYGIALLGLIVAGQHIGLHWDQIQWMATALTFGLAFGLQEMFANFVAGVIILFEQPVRVGDIVEIDNVIGVVSRIRIRATTITDWNGKDYIVPNKEFITGKILNWTRSDEKNRIVINVGIAYGSDTELARKLLLEVAHKNPHVLEDPKPIATFEGFGDNSLNFVLRAFLGSFEVRLETIHELHTAIDQAFRKTGIEISFPQRDLHLRGLPEGMMELLQSRHSLSEAK